MSVELQIVIGLASVVATIVGGYFALAKLVVSQFNASLDARFEAQNQARQEGRKVSEDRLAAVERDYRTLQTDFLKHLAELPREYVRREDHIRFETVITAKLDALYAEMRLIAERQKVGA